MERTSTASIKAALLLVAALFALSVYRAATGDVTPGEAWNYDRYIGVSWQESLRQYDVNNHVLNTLLARYATHALGRKEIAIRLPALFAGLLYCWAAWRLCRRVYSGWAFTLALALMTLNPLVVDALSEARGYGMAMAFWLLALDRMLLYLQELDAHNLNFSAMWLALSVTACLTFVVPVLALALALTLIVRRSLGRDLWLPLLVFLFVLLAIPLNRVLLSDFAHGATSLRQTLAELTSLSLGALPVNAKVLAAVVRVGTGVLVAAGLIVATRRSRAEPMLALTGGTAVIGLVLLILAHARLKAPFPERGSVYFVPVLTLLGLALFRHALKAMLCLSAISIGIYVAGLPINTYLDGQEFAGSRAIAKALRADAGQRAVRIAASPELEPIINYYRARYRQGNWTPVEPKPPTDGYDYYVLTTADAAFVERLHLRVLRRSPGLLLASR